MEIKNCLYLLFGTPRQDLYLDISFVQVNGQNNRGQDKPLGSSQPNINPAAIDRSSPIQIAMIQRENDFWVTRVVSAPKSIKPY
jgi:hypothetical protein